MDDNSTAAPSTSFNEQLRQRTKAAALRVIYLTQQLPKSREAEVIGRQGLRCVTSVAANWRAACRGRSTAEWHAELCICVEEADETLFWLELLGDSGILPKGRLQNLQQEYLEIVSILASARKKAKS